MAAPTHSPDAEGRIHSRIENYSNFWQKDRSKEEEADNDNRLGSYANVVNGRQPIVAPFAMSSFVFLGYYDAVTMVYEYAWSQSFHFSRFYKGESFSASLARHEHYLAAQMGLKPGMRVLDIGCGVGGPAREIARFADVQIIGLNNNDYQIAKARRHTKNAGLEDQIQFVKGDFMKLAEQFGENYFDAVYAIEATCHAPTWEGVYGEVFKVLKPGGIVRVLLFVPASFSDIQNLVRCLRVGHD